MNNTKRSNSESESIKRGIHALTATPIISNRRATTIGNVHRDSIYYPTVSEISPSHRSATTSASM